jgi:hypothetical protein
MADKSPEAESKPIRLAIHPSANLFPMLSDAELKDLGESIKTHGLREKIVVDTEGTLIDGRNRYEAMKRAGIALKAEHVTIIDFTSDDTPWSVDEYIVMANLERRMLTRDQRKELAGKLAVRLEREQFNTAATKDEKVDTLKKAADLAGVSRRTASSAKQEALVKVGLREAPTRQNAKKRPAKVDQAPPRPPSVIKALRQSVDAISKTKEKWDATRKIEACKFALQILSTFGVEAHKAAMENEQVSQHVIALLQKPTGEKKK